MLYVLLILSFFLLIYAVVGGPLPDLYNIKEKILRYSTQVVSVLVLFILTSMIFGTPFAGIFWGILGWFLPIWIENAIRDIRQSKLRAQSKDFITSAAGLYAANQVTPEVIQTTADRFPEPFASEFKEMLVKRQTNQSESFPKMFRDLAEKYGLSELRAVAAILAASENAGGPRSSAAGLKRLGGALRDNDRRMAERKKRLIEVKIASIVVILILLMGLAFDVTVIRGLFAESSGKIVLGLASMVVVGLIIMFKKVNQSPDLT